jgi:hypothetical protein
MPYCLTCGSMIDEYDSGYYARNMLCIPCYTQKTSAIPMVSCSRCGIRIKQDEAKRKGSGSYCNYCLSELERAERAVVCPLCKKPVESWQKSMKSPSGSILHIECAEKSQRRGNVARCIRCGRQTDVYKVTNDGLVVCFACAKRDSQTSAESPLLRRVVDGIGSLIG